MDNTENSSTIAGQNTTTTAGQPDIDKWARVTRTTTPQSAAQSNPVEDGPNMMFNIYEKDREKAQIYTQKSQFLHAKRIQKQKIANEMGVELDALFQCQKTMHCILKSDQKAINHWKYTARAEEQKAYLEWFGEN